MKNLFKVLALTLLLIGATTQAFAQNTTKKKVAVYMTGEVQAGIKKVIGSKIVSGVTESDEYSAVERTSDFLAELTKEQDYQLSGAVTDNQIAQIGQQFGVQYVLVADASEVFGSLFVSARLIDVQTAQIIKSCEASGTVSNMTELTKLADQIAIKLVITAYTDDNLKIHFFSSVYDLKEFEIPKGWHVATTKEMQEIIKTFNALNDQIKYPIYTQYKFTSNAMREDFTYYTYLSKKDKNKGKVNTKEKAFRIYLLWSFQGSLLQQDNTIKNVYGNFETDDDYDRFDKRFNDDTTEIPWGATTRHQKYYSMPDGYVYLLRNK